ncbi:hypothetical protein HQ544_01000 [Candidatus Falkowbacteria bacterium]|nr:hypothetical protein [Candidatus Falkowbacteria bacterium]
MLITDVIVKKLDIELTQPFSYYKACLNCLPYVLVVIKTNKELEGFGEGALAWDITGETQAGALEIMEIIKPKLIKKSVVNLEDVKNIMQEINENVYANSALKAGIEMALLDLLGKLKFLPVYKLFGEHKKKYVISQKTFSYKEEEKGQLEKNIKQALGEGVELFKFKIGLGKDKDIKLVKKIHDINPKIKIGLDVNQGFESAELAISIIKELREFNILWIEQPLYYQDYDGLAKIRKKTNIPIMADESCHNLLDLENLYNRDSLDLVNIKLAKCGGIFEALKMIGFCDKYNIGYMLGDMVHSALGTAANLQLAGLGRFISYDLTLPGRVKNDMFTGLNFSGYKAFIPQGAGLGIKKKG